ncbi:MAG TPA: DNA alkylation repair protein [Bryobacteraceae bacterium]|nr:DNA alkylation repair protein [Bryobacteraceae bacterium]
MADRLRRAIEWLQAHGSEANREGMARYAIPSTNTLGVSMTAIRALAKQLGRDHELASALWETGLHEARMLATFIADPAQLSSEEMDDWCASFNNWAICDSTCLHLFHRTAHASNKICEWSRSNEEFVKRAAFALIWSMSVHQKAAPDEPFLQHLELIEREAGDARNFVKKAVNMALRAIGKRSRRLNEAATATALRLADSNDPTRRWIGKHALRELTNPAVQQRFRRRLLR